MILLPGNGQTKFWWVNSHCCFVSIPLKPWVMLSRKKRESQDSIQTKTENWTRSVQRFFLFPHLLLHCILVLHLHAYRKKLQTLKAKIETLPAYFVSPTRKRGSFTLLHRLKKIRGKLRWTLFPFNGWFPSPFSCLKRFLRNSKGEREREREGIPNWGTE